MTIGVITSVSTESLPTAGDLAELRNESQWAVRRPLLGTFLGRETFASLTVENFSPTSADSGLANSSAPPDVPVVSTANFILLSVAEQRVEKSQILTTFGTSYAYFFGEQPRQLDVTALLLNTPDFRWDTEWIYNYENFFRGSRLTSSNTVVSLTYDNCFVRGYLTSCSINRSADNPRGVPLGFSMFVLDSFVDESLARSRRRVENEQQFFPDYGELLPPPQYASLIGTTVLDKFAVAKLIRPDLSETAGYSWDTFQEYVAGHRRKTVIPPRPAVTPQEGIVEDPAKVEEVKALVNAAQVSPQNEQLSWITGVNTANQVTVNPAQQITAEQLRANAFPFLFRDPAKVDAPLVSNASHTLTLTGNAG